MRKQRAFAGLTEQEIDQIAEMLRDAKYKEVRERIAKPRPEGFGLTLKSDRPLETLWAKKYKVDQINQKLETGQKLTISEFDAINAGEKADLPEKVHDAIMETTYELAISGDNTPTQLLTLQRLADFPARAELRARKEERDAEMHLHKIAMAEWGKTHKTEMDEHRKHMAVERLDLAKRSLELREKQIALHQEQSAIENRQSKIESDDLGHLATHFKDIERRAEAKFNLSSDSRSRGDETQTPVEETALEGASSTSPTCQITTSTDNGPLTTDASPLSLSPRIHPGAPGGPGERNETDAISAVSTASHVDHPRSSVSSAVKSGNQKAHPDNFFLSHSVVGWLQAG